MNRILVSPKALALATHLWTTYVREYDGLNITIADLSDAELAEELGLTVDTVYRAYIELQGHGALSMDARRQVGLRTVELHLDHWLFVAVEQAAVAKVGA